MSGTRVSDFFENQDDFDNLLETASDLVDLDNDKATQFLDDISHKFGEYGFDMFLSQDQLDWLNKLAEE